MKPIDFRKLEVETADVYFVDGLNGFCFDILRILPRDRTFLNTGSESLIEDAIRNSYGEQLLKCKPEEAIEKVLEGKSK